MMTNAHELVEIKAFFGPRASGWEERFPDDGPRYAMAVAELGPSEGDTILDLGCGTGRALVALRQTAGPRARVIGVDATHEMLAEARRLGRGTLAVLVESDAARLPFGDRIADVVFAAGLVPHLGDPVAGMQEMARVARLGGRLALFHPIGRAALAARHGGVPSDDDILSPARLPALLANSGWQLEMLDDGADRFLALAVRIA